MAIDISIVDKNGLSLILTVFQLTQFLVTITKQFTSLGPDKTQLAYQLYNTDTLTVFYLNQYTAIADAVSAILRQPFTRKDSPADIT